MWCPAGVIGGGCASTDRVRSVAASSGRRGTAGLDAHRYRRKEGRPLFAWVPDPLTPDRRREALALFAADNTRRLASAVGELDAVTERLARS